MAFFPEPGQYLWNPSQHKAPGRGGHTEVGSVLTASTPRQDPHLILSDPHVPTHVPGGPKKYRNLRKHPSWKSRGKTRQETDACSKRQSYISANSSVFSSSLTSAGPISKGDILASQPLAGTIIKTHVSSDSEHSKPVLGWVPATGSQRRMGWGQWQPQEPWAAGELPKFLVRIPGRGGAWHEKPYAQAEGVLA